MLAVYFLIDGISLCSLGFKLRPAPGSGWKLFNGIVAIVLGLLIWGQWPLSDVWAVGTLVGISMLLGGWSAVAIGTAARSGMQ